MHKGSPGVRREPQTFPQETRFWILHCTQHSSPEADTWALPGPRTPVASVDSQHVIFPIEGRALGATLFPEKASASFRERNPEAA